MCINRVTKYINHKKKREGSSNPTAACWYLGDVETPGEIAHSHRPSLRFARLYAHDRGCRKNMLHINKLSESLFRNKDKEHHTIIHI